MTIPIITSQILRLGLAPLTTVAGLRLGDHIHICTMYVSYVEHMFLDNVCIESMSVKMTKKTLERCTLNINSLTDKVRK